MLPKPDRMELKSEPVDESLVDPVLPVVLVLPSAALFDGSLKSGIVLGTVKLLVLTGVLSTLVGTPETGLCTAVFE